MPTTITGDATGITTATAVSAAIPTDLDPRNAASLTDLATKALNWARYFRDSAGILAVARTWTALQRFDVGVDLRQSASTSPLIVTAASVDWKLILQNGPVDANQVNVYAAGSGALHVGALVVARNAVWNGTQWARVAAGDAYRVVLTGAGVKSQTRLAAAASPWDDLDWDGGNIQYVNPFGGAAPAYATGFSNLAGNGAACFWKDAEGSVHLGGYVFHAAAEDDDPPGSAPTITNVTAFTLPAGYRPASGINLPCMLRVYPGAVWEAHTLAIGSAGTVAWQAPSGTKAFAAYLDGINFRPGLSVA